MATEIKIYIADGRDRDASIDMTPEQAARVCDFLSKVGYGDIYRHVPATGDGNKKGSESDRQVRMTADGIHVLSHAFDVALKEALA